MDLTDLAIKIRDNTPLTLAKAFAVAEAISNAFDEYGWPLAALTDDMVRFGPPISDDDLNVTVSMQRIGGSGNPPLVNVRLPQS